MKTRRREDSGGHWTGKSEFDWLVYLVTWLKYNPAIDRSRREELYILCTREGCSPRLLDFCAFNAQSRLERCAVLPLHGFVVNLTERQQRTYHDLVTLPSQKPVVSHGPPGYSAVSGHTVTVFGCTGFLGRYLVSKLGM